MALLLLQRRRMMSNSVSHVAAMRQSRTQGLQWKAEEAPSHSCMASDGSRMLKSEAQREAERVSDGICSASDAAAALSVL